MDSDDDTPFKRPFCEPDILCACKKIIRKLLFCMASFYGLYYSFSALFHGIFSIQEKFNGKEPFNFKAMSTLNFENGTKSSIAGFISMEATYFITTIGMALYLKYRVWDYAISLTLLHVFLCSAVMNSFPLHWQWWVGLIIGLLWMIVMGESIAYFFYHWYDKRKARFIKKKEKMHTINPTRMLSY